MRSIGKFFAGLWHGLDGLRRFLHLVLLLVIFGFVVGALRTSIPIVPKEAALVIQPEGEIVEQLSGDPLQRALQQAQGLGEPQTLLWDLTDAIRSARNDTRIKALVLDVARLTGAGQPTLAELAAAIREFRSSGKKVIARGTVFMQDQYYLAAQADEIYLDPLGMVLIDGYERYRMYLKGALDKLGVDVNVFKVGAYKSAAEVYTRTDMSVEDREESLAYLNSLWASYQQAIAQARGLPPGALARYVDDLAASVAAAKGDSAQVALDAKLVTDLKSALEVEQDLMDLVGENGEGSFSSVSQKDYLRVVRAEKKLRGDGKSLVGVVVASGEILDGEQPPGAVGADTTAQLVRSARLDDKVKAVVLRIDSPGGSMLASEEIHRELEVLRESGKPLVVSMGDLAASGGYYIAAGADEIWASPATITGSIGIFAAIPTFERTLGKIGVNVDGVGTTALSGQLRLDRPLGAEARTFLQATVDRGYEVFLGRVAEGRHKSRDQVNEIARGRVWPGVEAQKLGLVDHLGSFDDAVKAAAKRAKLAHYDVNFIEPELSWAQRLALQVKTGMIHVFFRDAGAEHTLARALRRLGPLERELERWNRMSARDNLYAYCFCAVQ
ncbi:MAG: signal peptide peptidase SppA [Gammaproteobacteria bacterium]|nr:signal peptide peptidase SppA [Gammaproteobacteria bacterium]